MTIKKIEQIPGSGRRKKMKKTMRIQAMAAFLLGTAVFGFAACGGNDHTASDSLSEGSADSAVSSSAEASSAEPIDPAVYDLTGFELAKYTSPIWEGSVSYAEGRVCHGKRGGDRGTAAAFVSRRSGLFPSAVPTSR